MCASAAYFLAAGATAIYASRTSCTGSIGVYLPMLDISGLYEKLGMRVDLIVNESGTLKTSGYPGTSLTDPQRADLQSLVEHAFGMFRGFVEEHRDVSEDAMKGQCFWGDQAVEMGLVDEIQDYAGAIDQAMRLA
jgi:protease-4